MASKSISKSVIWQLAGKFALQGIAFITTPIFTRLLSTEDYGYAALYTSWLSVITLITGLCVYGSIANARIKYGEEKLDGYLSSIMTISLLSFIILFTLSFFFRKTIAIWFGLDYIFVPLVFLHGFSSFIITFEVSRLNQLKKVEKSTLLSLTQSILVISLSLFFIFKTNGNKAYAKIFGQAIPIMIYGIVILFFVYYRGKQFWNKEYNKYCITFTLPLLLHGLGGVIFGQTDRIMLDKLIDKSTLGIYSVSMALCGVLTIIYGALNDAWTPFYYDFKKKKDYSEIINHTFRYVKLFTVITCGFLLLSKDVFKILVPKEYYEGIVIIPIITIGYYFGFLYLFPINYEFFCEKTTFIPVSTLIAAGLNIIFNAILIPKIGLKGAAIGTSLAYFFRFLFHEIVARLFIKSEYEYKNPFLYIYGLIPVTILSIFLTFFDINAYIRWGGAILFALYIIIDIKKNRSIF